MASKAFGIIASAPNYIRVQGLHDHRPIGAFSFLGRFRVIDFPMSNMSNSGIDRVQIYVNSRPRSIVEHVGSGRHYNINSKRGKVQILFTQKNSASSIYNNDITSYRENYDIISRMHEDYCIIAPAYMVYKQDYQQLLDSHLESGADITLLYQKVETSVESYRGCSVLNLNRQKGVKSITRNLGNAKDKNIFMDTYVMKKDLFLELIEKAHKESSVYTLMDIVSALCDDLDVRGYAHKGYFAAITSLLDYYEASMELLDQNVTKELFQSKWPIYTRTTDTCPTQYYAGANVTNSLVSNGCRIEGTVENSVIGRSVHIAKGAVVKDSVVLAYTDIAEGVHLENSIVDKWAKLVHVKEVIGTKEEPLYISRNDTL
ncbi:MAG: glucose-1-phosphate adenylyltransferase subunit GlgD [Butyrivibrio sp.]|nr:glucose-1-phosphate adenylyltransferase subunit GlgD [Butyrivibrio sp.]